MTSTVAPLDTESVLASIRSAGYWRIRFVPESDKRRFGSPSACRDAVGTNAVGLRGWDYPHFPHVVNETQTSAAVLGGWEAMVDWGPHREIWRLTQSGQFIHYRALGEDLVLALRTQGILDVSSAVYTLLEVFEFARRLTRAGPYGTNLDVEVEVANVMGRRLACLDPKRMLGGSHVAVASSVEMRTTLHLPASESAARSAARDFTIKLFDMFEFTVSPRVITGIQDELLERR